MISYIEKHKTVYIIMVIIFLSALLFIGAYNYVEKNVTIAIDGNRKEIKTFSKQVAQLLNEEGIELDERDYINVSTESKLKDNMEIVIKRAIPVIIHTPDKKIETKSVANTVGELLVSLNIEVDDNDIVNPSLEEKIIANTEIFVTKVDEITKTEKVDIPYQVVTNKNMDLHKGKVIKVQAGKNGIKEVKVREVYENGQLKIREVLEENIINKPIPEIVEVGTKEYLVTSRGNVSYRKSLTMVATGYDLSYESTGKRPGDKGYGLTASGTKARPGVVAVDPKVIPLGTKLYIKSLDGTKDYGFAIAEDTGGAIRGNRIDLFFQSRSEALKFGRKKVLVYILDW